MWKLIVSLCLIGAIAGCGSDVKNRMGTAAITTEEWPERDAIDEVIRGVGMAGERGSWRQAQQELDPTTFKTVLDALAASTAPGGYDDLRRPTCCGRRRVDRGPKRIRRGLFKKIRRTYGSDRRITSPTS